MKTVKLNDLKTKLKAISLSNTDLGRYGDGFEEAMYLVNKAVEAINYSQCSTELNVSFNVGDKVLYKNRDAIILWTSVKYVDIEIVCSGKMTQGVCVSLIEPN